MTTPRLETGQIVWAEIAGANGIAVSLRNSSQSSACKMAVTNG
jgi:hypothetical protein